MIGPSMQPRRKRIVFDWLPLAALALAVLAQTSHFRSEKSITFDETFYLHASLAVFWDGNFRPLSHAGVSPLPLLATYWLPALEARSTHPHPAPPMAPHTDAEAGRVDRTLIDRARRLNPLISGMTILCIVYVWTLRRRGGVAAAAAGSLVAFSPALLAHSALATTDAFLAAAVLLAVAIIERYGRDPGWRGAVMMGLASGLVLSAKYSGVFIMAVAFYAILRGRWPREQRIDESEPRVPRLRAALVALLILVVVAAAVFVISHGGQPASALEGLGFQLRHTKTGHAAYLMGRHSFSGWWYYYPIAFVLKSTPAELALLLVLLGAGLARLRNRVPSHPRDPAFALWIVSAAIYFAATMFSPINLGHRYLLVIYPLLVLAGVDWLARALAAHKRSFAIVATALAATQMASALSSAPHYLAYFNSIVGGPGAGHRYLLDSNLDWGQDLPALKRALRQTGCERPALQYFGTADPRAYGIDVPPYLARPGALAGRDCLAISLTDLFEVYGVRDRLSTLQTLEPTARAGHSIWIYDLDDPEVAQTLRLRRARGPRRRGAASAH
jgi:hypothetical protein